MARSVRVVGVVFPSPRFHFSYLCDGQLNWWTGNHTGEIKRCLGVMHETHVDCSYSNNALSEVHSQVHRAIRSFDDDSSWRLKASFNFKLCFCIVTQPWLLQLMLCQMERMRAVCNRGVTTLGFSTVSSVFPVPSFSLGDQLVLLITFQLTYSLAIVSHAPAPFCKLDHFPRFL